MPVAAGDILRVVAKMKLGEDDVQNVYHVRIDTVDGSQTDVDTFNEIAGVLDSAYDYLDGVQPDTLDYDRIQIYNLTQDTLVYEYVWPTLTSGISTSTVPPQDAALCLFLTDVLRSQGRKFLPPFGSGAIDTDGTITSSVLGYMLSYATSFIGGFTGTHIEYTFGNWNPTLARFAEWTGAIVRDFFATQRRRYVGSGS